MDVLHEIRESFRKGNNLTRLIYINLAVFFFIHILAIFFFLFNNGEFLYSIISYLAVPAELSSLFSKPWTLVSYMFLHKDFFHILFNLLWLYWFGKIFLEYFDEKRLLNVYLMGGISGGLFFILSYNFFPGLKDSLPGAVALGASASVMAIVVATAAYSPKHTIYLMFFGPVRIAYVALIGFLLSSVIDFSVNTGGKIAHIGGALLGYIFAVQYKSGRDISKSFGGLLDYLFSIFRFRKKKRMKVSYKRPVSDIDYNAIKLEKQQEVDRILDKISQQGYESLSKSEKEVLFKSGK